MVLPGQPMPAAYWAISAKRTGWPASATIDADQRLVERLEVVQQGVQHLGPLASPGAIGPDSLVEAPPGLADGAAHLVERGGDELGHHGLVSRVLDREAVAPSTHRPATNDRRSVRIPPVSHPDQPGQKGRAWFYCFRVRGIRQEQRRRNYSFVGLRLRVTGTYSGSSGDAC